MLNASASKTHCYIESEKESQPHSATVKDVVFRLVKTEHCATAHSHVKGKEDSRATREQFCMDTSGRAG